MRTELERDIQKAILDYLKYRGFIAIKHRNVGIYKKSTDRYIPLPADELGISDIIACAPSGRFVAIEVKRIGGKPSDAQVAFIKSVQQQGGLATIAYSIDDAIAFCTAHAADLFRAR